MSKKAIIIIVLIVLSTALIMFLVISLRGDGAPTEPTNPAQQGTSTPVTPIPTTVQGKISVHSANGGFITVNDFLKDKATVADPVNAGYYYLGNHYAFDGNVPSANPDYVISYIAPTQYFNISLTSEPVKEARLKAEQYLLLKLKISKEQMCALNYTVSVPGFVNESLSSISLGFSFCPGSVPL